jgi:hypothetical protein
MMCCDRRSHFLSIQTTGKKISRAAAIRLPLRKQEIQSLKKSVSK